MKNNYYVFWKRIFAYLIDMIILGIPSTIVCLLFFEPISSIGNWARLVGFIIFVSYFGLMNSKLCKGQTIGKKLFKIKVIDCNGDYLSVQNSLIRAVILSPVVILNGISISIVSPIFKVIAPILGILTSFNILLLIFNAPSRQIVHDLILKSYVVSNSIEVFEKESLKIIKVFVLLLLSAIFIIGMNLWASKYFNKKDYIDLNNSLENEFKDSINGIQYLKSYVYNPKSKKSKKSVEVVYTINAKNLSMDELKTFYNDKKLYVLAKQIIDNDKNIKKSDYLVIFFIKDANLGIGLASFSIKYNDSIENFMKKIKEYNIK